MPENGNDGHIGTPNQALIEAAGVELAYPLPSGAVPALRGVDLSLLPGETVCLFGASGSG